MENGKQVIDGNLEGIKKSLEGSLKRLKTDYMICIIYIALILMYQLKILRI